MFDAIAPAYDRTNTVLSFGLHDAWKRRAVRLAHQARPKRVLDVATGTGDLLRLHRRRLDKASAVGLDFSAGMLAVAKRRMPDAGLVRGDAMRPPFPPQAFGAATIAFGIRNVDDPAACLRALHDVLEPGGRCVVLEFGQPRGWFRHPYGWYSRHVMPLLGGWLTGNRDAYRYLPETAARFPCGEDFARMMREAGFHDVRVRALSGGVAWLYVGTRAGHG